MKERIREGTDAKSATVAVLAAEACRSLSFRSTEIVSRTVEGPIHRYGYGDAARRTRKLADALRRWGVGPGDRVATLAWNNYRHFEIEHGVTGLGAVWHAINPRLIPAQISYIANHAEDRVLFFDSSFLPIVEKLGPELPTVGLFVLMVDRTAMPATSIPNIQCYEDFFDSGDEDFEWPVFDELSASSLFYTSGTTGNPKGVLYSHRSDVLHCLSISGAYSLGFTALDTILPMTPMFHANGAWGFTHAAPMVGAKLVLPGPKMDAASIAELIEAEGVTVTAGVPTLYANLLQHFEEQGRGAGTLKRIVDRGSAPAPSMIEGFERLGVSVNHVWGMTETSPCGTSPQPSRKTAKLSPRASACRKISQGQPIYGVDVEDRRRATAMRCRATASPAARLMVRGPWVVSGYYRDEKPLLDDGWFNTGDLATIDGDNYHSAHRSRQGRHQVGRRVDQFDRCREPGDGLSGRGRGRGDRHSPSEVGRAAAACCRAQLPVLPDRTIDRGVSGRQDRQMVDARRCRLRRSAELRRNRQNPEDGVAPPLRRATIRPRRMTAVKRQAACLPAL